MEEKIEVDPAETNDYLRDLVTRLYTDEDFYSVFGRKFASYLSVVEDEPVQ